MDTPIQPDQHLLELAEESTYAYQMAYARLPGGESGSEERYTWYRGGLPGEFFNGIVRTNFSVIGLDQSIRETLRPFQARKLPMRWYIGPSSRPDELEEALQRCGLRFSWAGPALALDLANLLRPDGFPEELEVEHVDNPLALAEWIQLWVGSAPLEVQQRLNWVYTVTEFGNSLDIRLYLGKFRGRPVSTGAMFHGSPAVAIKHVCTSPAFQHRGFATILTLRALDDALALGHRYAALTSSKVGYPVYTRLGFQEVCRFTRYVCEP